MRNRRKNNMVDINVSFLTIISQTDGGPSQDLYLTVLNFCCKIEFDGITCMNLILFMS